MFSRKCKEQDVHASNDTQNYSVLVVFAVVATVLASVVVFVVISVVVTGICMWVVKPQAPQKPSFYLKCITI